MTKNILVGVFVILACCCQTAAQQPNPCSAAELKVAAVEAKIAAMELRETLNATQMQSLSVQKAEVEQSLTIERKNAAVAEASRASLEVSSANLRQKIAALEARVAEQEKALKKARRWTTSFRRVFGIKR